MSSLKRLHSQARIRRQGRPAFTLLELIVVLLVLGILAAIAVPTFNRVKENSAVRAAQTTLEAAARNGEAIAASDRDASDAEIAEAVEAEFTDTAVLTVSVSGDTVTVTQTNGAVSATGSVEFNGGVATIIDATVGGGSGGGSAFRAQTTTWSFVYWSQPELAATTVVASYVCGSPQPVRPYVFASDPELSSFGPLLGWEYSIDGAAFSQWMPTQTNEPIFGGTEPGIFMFYGLEGSFAAPEDPSTVAMCTLTSGQQVQFKTPSGLYSPILTIA